MRLLKLAALAGITGALLVFAATASAGGNGAQTFTQVDKNVVEVIHAPRARTQAATALRPGSGSVEIGPRPRSCRPG